MLPIILANLPPYTCSYVEPFLGGGSVYFGLHSHLETNSKGNVSLSEDNERLIYTYKTIQDDVDTLSLLLETLQNKYLCKTMEGKANFYYEMRGAYNEMSPRSAMSAALLIFLNKTCYNGLYRTNRNGYFNVPFGKRQKPLILNKKVMSDANIALRRATLKKSDFYETQQCVDKDTFVYLDPPFASRFTARQGSSFTTFDFARLMDYMMECDNKGAKVMMSYDEDIRQFIDGNHGQWKCSLIDVKCTISPTGSSVRTECLITNY